MITYFFGFKHWFGWTKPETISYHRLSLHTLFIGIVRDPYDWIMSFYKTPYHVPKSNRKSLDSFILNEWLSLNVASSSEILKDRSFITQQRYKNIFDMRTTKYRYLNETMPVITPNYVLFSYDTFLKNHENYLNVQCNFRLCSHYDLANFH